MKKLKFIVIGATICSIYSCTNNTSDSIQKESNETIDSKSNFEEIEKTDAQVVPGYIVAKNNSMELSISDFNPSSFLPQHSGKLSVYWVDTIRFDFVSENNLLKRIYIQDLKEEITKKESETLFEYKTQSGETKYVVKTLKISMHQNKPYNCILYLVDENAEFKGNLGFPK